MALPHVASEVALPAAVRRQSGQLQAAHVSEFVVVEKLPDSQTAQDRSAVDDPLEEMYWPGWQVVFVAQAVAGFSS